jgi:hypothetical protein
MLDMHPPILEARSNGRRILSIAVLGVAAMASLGAAAATRPAPGVAGECPMKATALVEHFIGADCMDCWKAAPPAAGAEAVGATEWSLDWIVPAADDAVMAAGALPEAADRLARLGPYLAARLATQPAAFDANTGLETASVKRRFYVHSSLPHQGYMGVQLHAAGVWPQGSSAWIALVELLPPGTRDSVLARHLVRVLVGPVKLPEGPGAKNAVAPLYGLRWPENAHADRLMAMAWVEGADGRVTQMASDRCADPH